jgi:hypothetical protein
LSIRASGVDRGEVAVGLAQADRHHDVGLGGVAAVERGRTDPGPAGDLSHAGAPDPEVEERLEGGVEHRVLDGGSRSHRASSERK